MGQTDTKPQTNSRNLSRRAFLAALTAASASVSVAAATQVAAQSRRSNGKAAIGAATAKRLARDGFALTVNCVVNRDLAAGVVREIEAAGGRAIWVQADVSDPTAVRRLFDEHERAFGRVDVVVANAGIMRLAPIRDMTDADFDRMFAVNAKGSFNTLREAALRVRDGGRIVTLSSSITQLRTPTYGPYAATKMAQDMFASILAKELEGRLISVNAVAPGVVNTTLFTDGKTPQQIAEFAQRTPHKRLGEPSDIADVIAALCGPDGGWVNGQTVFANGGIV